MRKPALVLLTAGLAFAQANPPAETPVPDWVRVEANIHYGQYPETVADILQPAPAALEKRPGVIVIHGGGWVGGAKEGMVRAHCLPYLKQGFVPPRRRPSSTFSRQRAGSAKTRAVTRSTRNGSW